MACHRPRDKSRPLLIGRLLFRFFRRSSTLLLRRGGRRGLGFFLLLSGRRVATTQAGQETCRHNHAKQFFHGPSSFLKVGQTELPDFP